MKNLSILGIIGRVIGFIFLAFIILIIGGIVAMAIISKLNNAYKGDYTDVLENNSTSAPKALIVFQPAKSNASKEVAEQMAKGLNEAGFEVTMTYPGKHLSENISKYSLIAFGSPVFMGQPSKAITETMKKFKDFTDKTVILYSVGAADNTPELDVMKENLGNKNPDYTDKFKVNDETKGQKAYELGLKAGKACIGVK